MREIKFRGLRIDNKEWAYGYYTVSHYCSQGSHATIQTSLHESAKVELHSLGQFTGLSDKNGTEIYEGDKFVPDTINEEVKAVVRWDEDSAKFVVDSYDGELSICDANDLGHMILEHCEVIGNIHTTHDKGKEETR